MTPRYEAVIVDRIPAASGPPTLVEIDALVGVRNVSWQRRLSAPDQASIGFPARLQSDEVKTRLMALDEYPVELWIYRNDDLVFAGPVAGVQVQGPTATITSLGLASYFDRWWIEPGWSAKFTDTDQFSIAIYLVNYWQALPYGHYGISTSEIGLSGVLRDRDYSGTKPHNIGQRLRELGQVQNGFDWKVTPDRDLILGYPTLGIDKTETIIVDQRVVTEATGTWSVGPRDFATEAYVWSNEATWAVASNPDLRAKWGRVGYAQSEANVTEQATLDAKAEAIVAATSRHLHVPSPTVRPGGDFHVEDLDVGDLIRVEFDYGFGLYTADHRVGSFQVRADDKGAETVRLDLL